MTSTATKTQATSRELSRTLIGIVVSDKRNKSRTVAVDRVYRHPKYGKSIRRQTNYHVHDEGNVSHQGDKVEIVACRPMSKTKTWRLVKVVEAAVAAFEPIAAEIPGMKAKA